MNIEQRAKELYNNPLASEATNQHNQQAYVKAIEYLGSHWILHTKVQRNK